jgi:hypothetical protein
VRCSGLGAELVEFSGGRFFVAFCAGECAGAGFFVFAFIFFLIPGFEAGQGAGAGFESAAVGSREGGRFGAGAGGELEQGHAD